MKSNELPDDGQDELSVTVMNIGVTDSDELNFELCSGIDGALAVVEPVEDVFGLHDDLWPFNDLVVNSVDNLAEDQTILQVFVKVVDEDTFDVEGVDPETVGSFLTGSFTVVEETRWVPVGGIETVLGVEHLGDEDDIDLLVTLADVRGTDDILASESE